MNARTLAGSLATAAVLGCLSLASDAATVVQSGSFGPTDQPYAISANGFDTTLGTLTGITVTFNGTATAELNVTNNSNSAKSFEEASATGTVTFNNFDGTPTPKTVNVNTGDDGLSGTVFGKRTTTFTSTKSTALVDNFSILMSDYSAYYGVGNTINFITGDFSGTAKMGEKEDGPSLSGTASALVQGNWTITYTYNATNTPEPGTMALLAGFGTSGVGFLLRKRRLSKSA